MRKFVGLGAVLSLTGAVAAQQAGIPASRPSLPGVGAAKGLSELFTRPALPAPEALDRLNLRLAWRVYVPTEGRRDGLFSVQVMPDAVFIQTRSGQVVALDPADGSIRWRVNLASAYRLTLPLGFNSNAVFATRGVTLVALERRTGQIRWDYSLPHAPTAAPASDDEQLYQCMVGGRLFVYDLPHAQPRGVGIPAVVGARGDENPAPEPLPLNTSSVEGRTSTVPPSVGPGPGIRVRPAGAPQPQFVFDHRSFGRLEQTPLLAHHLIVAAGADGTYFAIRKYERKLEYEFQADAPQSAPLAQYGTIAYMASQDFNVYAVDMLAGRIVWRFTGGGPILRQPIVMDEDIYVTPERIGLYRLDRATGEQRWRHPEAMRFLAANRKYVYAADRAGRLLVLDRERGTELVSFDPVRDYVVPIANEVTDRLYLAANDGLVVCLHDRDYVRPLDNRRGEQRPAEEPIRPRKEPAAKEASPGAGGEDR